MPRLKRLVELAARTPVLVATAIIAATLVVAVFPALPIGGDLLDTRFGYTHAAVLEAMATYGEHGRRVYLWSSLTLDTLLPVAYVGLLAGALHRLRPRDSLWQLAFVPLAAGVLDLCENFQIVAMLISYPDVLPAQVAAGSLVTKLKAVTVTTSVALVAVLAVLASVRRLRS